MKLLICTQIVDVRDPALGFFHRWIEEFALHAQEVHVICLKEGEHHLPPHVYIHSLGKELRQSRLRYLRLFYTYVWRYRKSYDTVFVHMNPEYVVLAGVLWRAWGKKVSLWYTHRTVNLVLKIAVRLMHHGFTGSVESFRIKSPKILVTGQGVDTSIFVPPKVSPPRPLTLLVVGRIAPIKNLELAIDALVEVRTRIADARLVIVGAPVKEEDFLYEQKIRKYISDTRMEGAIDMVGGKDADGVLHALQHSDIFLHTSQTNSADKTAVEAMATELYMITSSPVYVKDLPPSCAQPPNAKAYAAEIVRYMSLPESDRIELRQRMRAAAVERHSLARLIRRITDTLRGV